MRRDTFLKTLAALAATGALPAAWAQPGANLKILIPANPGGGWDTTGRALGKAMLDAKQASTVTYDNKAARPAPWAWRPSWPVPRAMPTR